MAPASKLIGSTKPEAAGAKVVVACKLPAGLWLRSFRMVKQRETTLGGTREIELAEEVGERFRINGNKVPFGVIPQHKIAGNYAITEGVPEDLWNAWLKDNERAPMVVNNLIFAEPTLERAVDRAKDQRKVLSGLEPFKKDGDPRKPKRGNLNLDDVVEEEDRAARVA